MADFEYIRIANSSQTAEQWKEHNPILFTGEIGFETDTGLKKTGRNNIPWNDLPYDDPIGPGDGRNTAALKQGKSLAGSKAFTIKGINAADKTYTLDSVTGLQIGDIFSIHLKNSSGSEQAENYGTIREINGYNVKVDNFLDVPDGKSFVSLESYIDESTNVDSEQNTFRVVAKPQVGTRIIGDGSTALGVEAQALSKGSFAHGRSTVAYGSYSYTEGKETSAAYCSHAEGRTSTASGQVSHAEGQETKASGTYSHAEGQTTQASGQSSHSEGYNTIASGADAHAEGLGGYRLIPKEDLTKVEISSTDRAQAVGEASHIEGKQTHAAGARSHAEGYATYAGGSSAHSEGHKTQAMGEGSHAEGGTTLAKAAYSHAEGVQTTASGTNGSHAEGYQSTASGQRSHAEGSKTTASNTASHAEGGNTTASGECSHAEGNGTVASNNNAHAEGQGTIASGKNQHVQGKYNVADAAGTYAHIVGGGQSGSPRNIHTLDWDGNAIYAGDVFANNNKKLATEEWVRENAGGNVDVSGKLDANGWTNENGVIGIYTDELKGIFLYPNDGVAVTYAAGTMYYGPQGMTGTVDISSGERFSVTYDGISIDKVDENYNKNYYTYNYPNKSGTLLVDADFDTSNASSTGTNVVIYENGQFKAIQVAIGGTY